MYSSVKSALDRPAPEVEGFIDHVLAAKGILTPEEVDFFAFLKAALPSGNTPTERLFLDAFPQSEVFLRDSPRLSVQDARAQFAIETRDRERHRAAGKMRAIAEQLETQGWSDEYDGQLRKIRHEMATRAESPLDHDLVATAKAAYLDSLTRPPGLKTYVRAIDDAIGAMAAGSLNTIMGFTGQFKTMWALNIAYHNAFKQGLNIAFMSLEMPRVEIFYYLLSLHSADPKFDQCLYIPHDSIRQGKLSEAEIAYLFDVIAPDFTRIGKKDDNKGQIFIVDSSQFRSTHPDDLYAKMEEIDDYCQQIDELPLHAFIWDHVQMFKFNRDKSWGNLNETAVMNAYVHQFMDWAMHFRGRQTIQLLLAQTNREGYRRAERNGGHYEITALAEVNEAERASSRVLSIFTDAKLKASKEVKIQILKSRYGAGLYNPVSTLIEPEYARVGGEEPLAGMDMDSDDILHAIFGD